MPCTCRRICPDAVERVVGNEQDVRAILADDFLGRRIGLPVRLEIARLLDRNDVVEREVDVRPRRIQHVAIAVRQDRQFVACSPQLLERGRHVRKWLELLDLADEPPYLVRRVSDAAAVQDVRDGSLSDLPISLWPRSHKESIIEFSKCVRRHQVTNRFGSPPQPFCSSKGATASVSPFCMSTTVPYWSN